ncbi:uncharacterized protein RCO7_11494 [Rhynchosporium graminicola]|uniref:Uncharacterized protein n=1 Tax=Rhynchosporium graminicola TaxID=2792576 RepID=A0A1E1KMH8_9HELO|nr:uncharacterized protein RCO7_11494 [Rhynchosporium commune]
MAKHEKNDVVLIETEESESHVHEEKCERDFEGIPWALREGPEEDFLKVFKTSVLDRFRRIDDMRVIHLRCRRTETIMTAQQEKNWYVAHGYLDIDEDIPNTSKQPAKRSGREDDVLAMEETQNRKHKKRCEKDTKRVPWALENVPDLLKSVVQPVKKRWTRIDEVFV